MARPVHADADATQRRMLDAATLLFSERGAEGTSVRDVATASDVSLAMVSHYFGSKDALYQASIRATFTELAALKDELAAELAANAPSDELVATAIATGFRFAREHRVAVRLLLRAAVSTGELTRTGSRLLFEMLDQVSTAVGATLGRPPAELRLPLQSLVFLIARYAAQNDAEMAKVVGASARGKAAVAGAVERHLVRVGLDGLGLSTRSRR